jgi:hypothetical protein
MTTVIPTSTTTNLTTAQAKDAIARWERRTSAHAREGEFREADDAESEALDLRRAYLIDRPTPKRKRWVDPLAAFFRQDSQ